MFSKDSKYLILVTIIFIAACIETDIYLPAFADMMAYFSISETVIQSLLTWNFVGICLSGPIYGPLSDAIGRKKPLMAALTLFLLGSLITIFAMSFNWMLFGRILQGLGSGGCFTLGTAIIFDVFQEKKAIAAMNKLNGIIPFIMAAAPMIGGYLNYMYGFRSNFVAIAICVLLSLLICLFFFEETLDKKKLAPLNLKKVMQDFKTVLSSVPFWQTTMITSLLFSGYLAFLSWISVLFAIEFEISKSILPFFQAALLGAWLVANQMTNSIIARWGIPKVKMLGTALIVAGGIGLVITALTLPTHPYLLTFAMMLYTFGCNWTFGLYFPEAMEIFPDIKGITASLITSMRLFVTSIVIGVVSMFYNATIYPIVIAIAGIVIVTTLTIFCYERRKSAFKLENLSVQ
ncbi:MAG: MFS transporter [Parachlamydiaceae bacterium]|nr:MFS transporter [Parachlamydiaceae bacterium]